MLILNRAKRAQVAVRVRRMRRTADLCPGEAKTGVKDAAVIADTSRTMPHTLRSLELTEEITAQLTVLAGFDQDLAAEGTRTSNRIRGLLTHSIPRWNASWAHAWIALPSPGCWNATAHPRPCGEPAGAGSSR